jgi:SOS-response transcriptional repressor LexA
MRPASPAPTPAQMQLWSYLVQYVCENGYQPSQTEMGEHFGITQASVQDRLKGLQERGYLFLTGVERAIQMPDLKFCVEKRKP